MSVERAKEVLTENSNVLYGIFGFIETTWFFPPRNFLNVFLQQGSDPCDQDRRMNPWTPFILSESEYEDVKEWWLSKHPGTVVDDLGESRWNGWTVHLREM